MSYVANTERYDGRMPYRRVGKSGMVLPAISLGLWQNFGGVDNFEIGRAVVYMANQGGGKLAEPKPPAGAASAPDGAASK